MNLIIHLAVLSALTDVPMKDNNSNAWLKFVFKSRMRSTKHAVKYKCKLLLAFCCVSYAVFFQMKSLLNSPGFGVTGSSG